MTTHPTAISISPLPLVEAATARITEKVAEARARGVEPTMAVIVANDDPAVLSYAQAKKRNADKLGIAYRLIQLPADVTQAALNRCVADLSADASVHGVLLELPVRDGLDGDLALAYLNPAKDIDGLVPHNMGMLASGQEDGAIQPATPQACILLAETQGGLAGKRVAVIGRGRTVGRPLASMLINRHATVTVCHSKTPDLAAALRDCDVVFVAIGRAGFLKAAHVRAGQVVIDAGISVVEGKVRGDVDAASVAPVVAAYSPVPGGVGRLTSSLIFQNLMKAIDLQKKG